MKESVDIKQGAVGAPSRLRPLSRLRFRMQVLLALVALPALFIIALFGFQERRQVIDGYRHETSTVTAQLVRQHANSIEGLHRFLVELAQTPPLANPSEPACPLFLAQMLLLHPHIVDLALAGPDGTLLCQADPLSEALSSDDPSFFRRALDEKALSVSPLELDYSLQAVRVGIAVPIQANPGTAIAVGAMGAAVTLDWGGETLENLGLPSGAMAFVTDSAGRVVASVPKQPELFGRLASEIGFGEGQAMTDGGGITSRPDGVRRVFSQQTLFEGADLGRVNLSLGVPIEAGIAAATQSAAYRLLGFGGVMIVLWLIALFQLERGFIRPLNTLYHDIRQLEKTRDVAEDPTHEIDDDQLKDTEQITQSVRKISREQKLAETAKKEQAEKFEALLQAMPDNYFRFDRQGIILDYRLRLKISLIKDAVAHYGHSFADLLPPVARQQFEENFRKHHKTKEFVTWDYQLEVDGVLQVREGRLCPVAGSDETIFVVRDITKRYTAEKNKASVDARFERIITNFPGAVLSRKVTSAAGAEVTYVSPQCIDIWGYTPEEVYAVKGVLETTVDEGDMRELYKLMFRAATELEPFSFRYQITTRLGKRKWLESNTNAYLQEDGSTHTDGFILDVTTEMETRQLLDKERDIARRTKNVKTIAQMTGGVAHEFNNLLAAVMGSFELLRDDLTDTERFSLIDAGISATRRGADLARNMLAYARRARLEPSVIDLNKIVVETRNWAGRALASDIEIETSLLTGLWATNADVSSTESALLKLISNAKDAMPAGGRLTIETSNVCVDEPYVDAQHEEIAPGRYVVVSVTDTGHGMSKDTLNQIFEPFFTTKPPGAGAGLGLPMVLGFMKQSGGTVQVHSELEVGTTVKLFFKAILEDVSLLDVDETDPVKPAHARQKILVVEDETGVLTVLITSLEKAGYCVTAAETGDEALAMFETDPTFDLLLTDIVMPGSLQGPALSQVIRDQAPDIPVIFMSGYASETTAHGVGVRPDDTHLTKPIRRSDLIAAIEKSLAH